jgi:NADPH:quinone reductase-like Zn-dependent oxidoreductase
MKTIVYTEYGSPDVLQFQEVEKPTPKDNEVLVKVHAVSLNIRDWFLLTGSPFITRLYTGGMRKPKNMLGADIAGRVEAVGSSVTQFKPGDEVFGDISAHERTGLAEYVAVPEDTLVLKPANVSFEEAAAVPMAAVTALQGLRDKGQIQSGQKVLINGASGGVGTFAVQIAKAFGAEVTAVCSTRNVDTARSIGADHVIDYKQEDFTRNGQRYDLILAANGARSLSDYQRALNPNGTYICAGGSMPQIFQSMLLGPIVSKTGSRKIGNIAAEPRQQDLAFVSELLQARKVIPVIDRCYPFSETAEAMRYLGERHARGKVVISMEQGLN